MPRPFEFLPAKLAHRLAGRWALAVLAALLLWSFLVADGMIRERDEARFDRETRAVVAAIRERIDKAALILQGGAALIACSDEVTRDEWRRYFELRGIGRRLPGAAGFGFAPAPLPPGDAVARGAGRAVGLMPVALLEPDGGHGIRVGDDLLATPAIRDAVARAARENGITLSAPFPLDAEERPGRADCVLLCAPVTADDLTGAPSGECAGFVFLFLRVPPFLDAVFAESDPESPDFDLRDASEPGGPALYARGDPAAPRDDAAHNARKTLPLPGRAWSLDLRSTPPFEAESGRIYPVLILMAGFTVCLLLHLLLRALGDTGDRAAALAENLTADLRREKELHGFLLDALPIGVAIVGDDFTVMASNATMRRWFPGRIPGSRASHSAPPDPGSAPPAVRALRDGMRHEEMFEFGTTDGRRTMILVATPIDACGEARRAVLETVEDVTERLLVEDERVARLAAENANRQKSTFLAHMSHEIRTPMNSILGFTQLLERDLASGGENLVRVRSIDRAGRHLMALIDDILDMAKIEAGMARLRETDFDLRGLIGDLETMFRSRAAGKGIRLIFDIAPDLPRHARGDEGKLRQILVNLVGNAIKFTAEGGVSARYRAARDGEANGAFRFEAEVEDSGPGIAPEDMPRIFDPFRQGAAGAATGGTGLGLAICSRFAELMGGRVTAESVPGRGSRFLLEARLREAAAPEEVREPPGDRITGVDPGSPPRRILIVDDIRDNRRLIRELLAPCGFELREAGDGTDALRVFSAWRPHAVLMDMRMPVMDGYEATREIKGSVGGAEVPIVAVTASAFRESEKEIRDLGVAAYLRKPFRAEELYGILAECLGLRLIRRIVPSPEPIFSGVDAAARGDPAEGAAARHRSAIPSGLLAAMRDALDDGDMAGLELLIRDAGEYDAAAARGVAQFVARCDLEGLAAWIAGADGWAISPGKDGNG